MNRGEVSYFSAAAHQLLRVTLQQNHCWCYFICAKTSVFEMIYRPESSHCVDAIEVSGNNCMSHYLSERVRRAARSVQLLYPSWSVSGPPCLSCNLDTPAACPPDCVFSFTPEQDFPFSPSLSNKELLWSLRFRVQQRELRCLCVDSVALLCSDRHHFC